MGMLKLNKTVSFFVFKLPAGVSAIGARHKLLVLFRARWSLNDAQFSSQLVLVERYTRRHSR